MTTDVIDQFIGAAEGDAIFELRGQRPDAKLNAQASFEALFQPRDTDEVSLLERLAIGYWAVALAHSPVAGFYAELLADHSEATLAALDAALPTALTSGPYGNYPDGPLSAENAPGLRWEADPALRAAVGPRLAAALAHTHLLSYRPREASASALQRLLDAGWSTTGIVTISQLVAFVNFQLRVVAGLTVLNGTLG